MTITDEEIARRLDLTHIQAAAELVAETLDLEGAAGSECHDAVCLGLTPGDMTVYHLILVAPHVPRIGQGNQHADEYMVTLANSFGGTSPWAPQYIDPTYAASKWTKNASPTDLWTGAVVATFLNALATAIAQRREET